MTPERLNELAEMIEHDEVTVKEGREIAAYLRECAKAEPVATIIKPDEDEQIDGGTISIEQYLKLCELPIGTELYAHPPKQEQSPKVAPTVAIDERAEFEKWANKHNGGEPLQLGGGGTYTNPFANAAYEAWQAARKLSAPEVISKTTDTVVPDAKDEIDHDGIWTNSDVAEQRYIQGWNDCLAAVIRETE